MIGLVDFVFARVIVHNYSPVGFVFGRVIDLVGFVFARNRFRKDTLGLGGGDMIVLGGGDVMGLGGGNTTGLGWGDMVGLGGGDMIGLGW